MTNSKVRSKTRRKRQNKKLALKPPTPPKPPVVKLDNAEVHMSSFIKYYKALKLVPDDEWDAFFSRLLSPLPFTFRLAENHRRCINRFEGKPNAIGQAEVLRDFFKEFILPTTEDQEQNEDTKPFKAFPVSTFPKDLVWQCNTDHKTMLGKTKLKKLRTFIFEEGRGSYLFKQEISNMVGPWLVDIHPDNKILEMCCAPGYQSAQIAERLHVDPKKPAEGFLLCNDAEKSQLNYRWAIGTNTMFSHEKAARFPDLYTTTEHHPDSKVEYDIVFLDAPSSKDGEFRLKTDLRGVWDMNGAHGFHKKLKPMLRRAVELVAVNGKVVYSTTSFNPIENEAVVAEILRQAKGSLELVDISSQLTGFKTRPGMDSWKVMNPGMVFYQDFATCPTWFKKDHDESAFPPTEEESETFQLNRCMRILPHDNDTNGAFYAVIRKVSPLPVQMDITDIKQEVIKQEKIENDGEGAKGAEGEGAEADEKGVGLDGKEAEPEGDVDRKDGIKMIEGVDGQDKKPQPGDLKKPASSKQKHKKQERRVKHLSYDLMMTVTEIDWITEVTDEALNTESEAETIKYLQPGLKIAKSCVRSWYGLKTEYLFSRFENVDIQAPEMQFISKAYGLNLSAIEGNLMAGVHDLKGTRYYYISPCVKQIVQSNQIYFQQAAAHAAGFFFMLQAADPGEMAIQALMPMALEIKKRLVQATKEDLIELLNAKTVSITALTEGVQKQLKTLDDKGPLYFIYEPKGLNPDPKCPILLKREKVKIFIQDINYNQIENCNLLRLCGVNTLTSDLKLNEEEPMEADEDQKEGDEAEDQKEEDCEEDKEEEQSEMAI